MSFKVLQRGFQEALRDSMEVLGGFKERHRLSGRFLRILDAFPCLSERSSGVSGGFIASLEFQGDFRRASRRLRLIVQLDSVIFMYRPLRSH